MRHTLETENIAYYSCNKHISVATFNLKGSDLHLRFVQFHKHEKLVRFYKQQATTATYSDQSYRDEVFT